MFPSSLRIKKLLILNSDSGGGYDLENFLNLKSPGEINVTNSFNVSFSVNILIPTISQILARVIFLFIFNCKVESTLTTPITTSSELFLRRSQWFLRIFLHKLKNVSPNSYLSDMWWICLKIMFWRFRSLYSGINFLTCRMKSENFIFDILVLSINFGKLIGI